MNSPEPATSASNVTTIAKGIVGAVVGSVVGYMATGWLAEQGLYAIALPGALCGLGCGFLSGKRSIPLGVICLVVGLLAGLVTEGLIFPFNADESLAYFFRNLSDLTNATKVLILIGGAMAAWFGVGRT